jgi:bifunctional non-homologous end joining protein LigD
MAVLAPMLVTPAAELPVGDWAYETKWDGMRALIDATDRRVTVTSRPGRSHADTFPELARLADVLDGHQVLLDGEIVCMGADGKPSFEQLGTRLANAKRARFWTDRIPAIFVAFDLLRLDGTDLMDRPWDQRRAALVALDLDRHPGPWRLNPAYDEGTDLLAVTAQMGLEGVVAKYRRSAYRPGIRTRWWLKCKNLHRSWMDVFGWQPPRQSTPGGLIVGDNGRPDGVAILTLPAAERHALLDVIHRYGQLHGERLYVPPGAIQGDVTYLERTPRGFLRHAAVRAVRPAQLQAP